MLFEEPCETQVCVHGRQGQVALQCAKPLPAGMCPFHIQDLVRGKQEAQGQEPKQRFVRTLSLPQSTRRHHARKRLHVRHVRVVVRQGLFEGRPPRWGRLQQMLQQPVRAFLCHTRVTVQEGRCKPRCSQDVVHRQGKVGLGARHKGLVESEHRRQNLRCKSMVLVHQPNCLLHPT